MPQITLPDGSVRTYRQPVTVAVVAADIGAGLSRAALAGKVDGRLVDIRHELSDNTTLSIVTAKDECGLDIIRHSTAHLLAAAVKSLFPEAQVTIGPVIENGFYYDFAYEPGFNTQDLEKIEQRMQELAASDDPVERSEMSRNEAITYFQSLGEQYKAEIVEDIPAGQTISLYRQGDFVDLCRGPHVPSTGRLKAFKLTKLAGAYWRGDSDREMLQRIYGTAWPDKKQLKAYLQRLTEAEKRDHRRLAKQLDLFHLQEEAPGMVFWHPRGWQIYLQVAEYMRQLLRCNGYQEIHTPEIVGRVLWEKSGHWEKFGDEIFTTHSEKRDYAIKPMNCPCHIQVFNQGLKSYRDLPLRLAEFGSCHRNEASGTLHGLMRVRNFVQDDAHIFCTEEQIQSEVAAFIDLLQEVYQHFGFTGITVNLSTRPEKRIGSDAVWDQAEAALAVALDHKQLNWTEKTGDGAFYGPKIDFSLHDSIGRSWQCGTMQVDFFMPGRLGASYVTADGTRQAPIMLHRAILGSLERFTGILIEEHEGRFPLWLAPVQLMVLTITDQQQDYAKKVTTSLIQQGFRAECDLRNEKIGFKIREHTLQRIPYLLVIGNKEVTSACVAVRTREGEDLGVMDLPALVSRLRSAVDEAGRVSGLPE
ncbi:MAG TPA: threonine--tRNA ligase [Gammaproteobacteria bacterium]|nr:threonine--tRNA ligase [Gammaproteobacteria bacterium]